MAQALLTDDYPDSQWTKWEMFGSSIYYAAYDAEKGCLVPTGTPVNGYGKSSVVKGETNYDGPDPTSEWKTYAENNVSQKDAYIVVMLSRLEGLYCMYWVPTT